jgi:putative transposase
VLYGFFIIAHDRRRILHYNVTRHPTSAWIVQQLREAFPYEPATQFLILDHDSNYGTEVSTAIRSMNIKAVRTTIGCPWQNGVAERWVGSCRRELLDHVIAINESHLKRLLSSYVAYYNCASYCPPRYVVGSSKPFCCGVGIAGSRLLRRTRSTKLAATSVSSAL